MKSVGRFETGVALALLAVTSVLWLLAALFIFRVADVFHAYLMKFPGPWLTLGLMVVGPVVAMVLGVRTFCRTRARVMGATLASAGGLLLVAFGVVFGIPMLSRAIEPKTPKNPSTPRLFTPLAGLPVFPGAEGFGTDTPAGRGGRVLEVTTLADDGPGSLRAALNVPEPRIVVFRVGGTIELKTQLFIAHPFVTVAGQTAPGGGICIKNAGLVISTHDVLVRHVRIRPGNEGSVEPDTNDAVEILGKRGNSDGAHHVVLDHVSASWSEDETISTWYGAHDVTISWCIISEALNRSRHRKKTHSAGLLIGDSSYNVSVHHCLLAHNDFRNPLIMEGGTHDFVNNVVYDWGVLCAEVVDYESNSFLNFVGNAFLPGPSTKTGPYEILIEPEQGTPRIYVKDNIGPRRPDASVPDWNVVKYGWNSEQHAPESYHSSDAFAVPPVTTFDADEALEQVLAACGATRPVRDGVDRRVVAGVKNKTGAIIDSPADVGGYPELSAGTPPADRDHDAMPDEWETQKGLGADDPTDASGDLDGDGYTNLEEYLNSLVL
jgi:pectate lyase